MHQATARLSGIKVVVGDTRPRHITEAIEQSVDGLELAAIHASTSTPPPGAQGFGLGELDDLMGWMRPGELVLVAGRPRTGSRELLTTLIATAGEWQQPTLVISTSRSAASLWDLVLSAAGRVPLEQMRRGMMSERDWSSTVETTRALAGAPLFVDDAPIQTPATIASAYRELDLPAGGLVVIDDLQQLAADIDGANLYETTAGIARALKVLARDLGVVVVAGSGLNRGPEMRTDKKPQLQDLRGAGDLEDIADHVLLTSCDDAYDWESSRAGEMDIFLAKNPLTFRAGRYVVCVLQRHYSRVVSLAP